MKTKNEYIAPAMEVVEMEVISMLADSQWEFKPGEEGEELSNRRRNFWEEIGGK